MNNKNRKGKRAFVFWHLYWLAMGAYLYFNSCFCCVLPTYEASRVLFWSIAIVFTGLGIVLTIKRRRNNLSIFTNVMMPFSVYALLSYGEYYPTWLLISLGVSVFISALYCWSVVSYTRSSPSFAAKKCLYFCLMGMRTIIVVCFSAFVFLLFGKCYFGASLVPVSIEVVTVNRSEENTLDYNRDVLEQLEESIWASLSETEKVDVLQVVANVERNYLGLPHELNLQVRDLDDGTLGAYYPSKHVIAIDIDHLRADSSADVLNSVTHECFHAYQRVLVEEVYALPVSDEIRELHFFRILSLYSEDFSHQEDVEDFWSYLDYYGSDIEYDARKYAEASVKDYFDQLEIDLPEGYW